MGEGRGGSGEGVFTSIVGVHRVEHFRRFVIQVEQVRETLGHFVVVDVFAVALEKEEEVLAVDLRLAIVGTELIGKNVEGVGEVSGIETEGRSMIDVHWRARSSQSNGERETYIE